MKASKIWHCSCCDSAINPGEEMKIVNGEIFKADHPTKTTRQPEKEEQYEQIVMEL
jgi:ribosomal protein L37AE/L43A